MIPTWTSPTGGVYLDVKEIRAVSKSDEAYFKNTADPALRQQFYDDLMVFLEYVINYANGVFKGKSYTFDHVAPQLFVTKINSEQQYKQYLRNSLYAAKLYAEKLIAGLKVTDMENCKEFVFILMGDYEWLLAEYENACCGNSVTTTHFGSRRSMKVMDIKFGANQLMFLEQTETLARVDMRNTKPIVMFAVRQCIEVLGKNLVGFDDIVDAGGHPIHQFTQVAWTFLQEMEKQGKTVAQLPMKAATVQALNSWTNSFVHHPYIYASYVQFYALQLLYALSQPVQTPVTCYDGKNRQCMDFGNFVIPSFAMMKQEFEAYLHQIRPSLTFTVNWLKPEEVGAYVMAL